MIEDVSITQITGGSSIRFYLDAEKDGGAEEADPYILGMALKLKNAGFKDVRVVTEENKDTPRKTSLRTAAGVLGLASVPLRAFLNLEGIDC